ncbi:MAG: UDP-N-acetylmuramoyl-L-alanine--D-glutamate ligase [Deltaproteobacteria bacterium]|nr:UDP-N-acetylmuramoyl-L-alanine--D-glutamate ligase [Deltaproteobacteria bacterium]
MDLIGKKILIVGFGKSGQAAKRYCLEQGALVTVTDDRFGKHPSNLFEEADIIIPSPGVPLTLDGIKRARAMGKPIVGEMELLKFDAPIVAITGTNGKSTVTTLIGEMLKAAGKKAPVGGNLGTPLLDMAANIKGADYVVLEVSSYQLEISPTFHPHVAVLLNVTPDHLDRYAGMQEYIDAKALIIKNLTVADYFIYNADDSIAAKIAGASSAKKTGFSAKKIEAKYSAIIDKMKMTGAHNKENMYAAAAAAFICGCDAKSIQRAAETFSGLPHRNQFVREIGGVKYFDDSKGTNVGAVVKSLEGFDSKVVLIAGGLDKGGSYNPLKEPVKNKVKALILMGAAREKIAGELGALTETVLVDSMAAAVREAAARALKGDVVLLSPACSSLDMFKDYAERGDKFAEEVNKL